jgi:hypothetical protein
MCVSISRLTCFLVQEQPSHFDSFVDLPPRVNRVSGNRTENPNGGADERFVAALGERESGDGPIHNFAGANRRAVSGEPIGDWCLSALLRK